MTDHHDEGATSGDELDLRPRTDATDTTPPTRRRSWGAYALLGLVGVAIVAVLGIALTQATVFFYNVDEALERQAELGDDTFRMQGSVVTETEVRDDGALLFTIGFDGEQADIVHVGDEPSDLFEVGIPVVVQGRWETDGHFLSEQILVKHSETYEAENQDRLDDAYDGADG